MKRRDTNDTHASEPYARNVEGLTEDTFVCGAEASISGVGRYVSANRAAKGTTTLNVLVASDDVRVYLRGYMVVRETASGVLTTYYTPIASGTYGGSL